MISMHAQPLSVGGRCSVCSDHRFRRRRGQLNEIGVDLLLGGCLMDPEQQCVICFISRRLLSGDLHE